MNTKIILKNYQGGLENSATSLVESYASRENIGVNLFFNEKNL